MDNITKLFVLTNVKGHNEERFVIEGTDCSAVYAMTERKKEGLHYGIVLFFKGEPSLGKNYFYKSEELYGFVDFDKCNTIWEEVCASFKKD